MTATAHDFVLPVKTETDLRDFVRLAFGISIPDVQMCPNHSTPWRAFCSAYFARSPVEIWEASRGFGGKSFLLAILGLTEAVTLKCDVNILGGSGEQSTRVHDYMQRFWNYPDTPRYLLDTDPSKRETKFTWGNQVQALMASQASVRGPHPVRLRLDEIDEMDLDILDAAMGQPMSKDGIQNQTVMSSTHQYADGTMTEILKRAGEGGWPVHTWCYRECLEPHGWLPLSEVESKKTVVTTAMWDNEYELQEPSPESRAIQTEKVNAMFREYLGHFRGAANEYIEIEPPAENARYAHGADWARKMDWTVIITQRTDVRPMRLVAFERTGRADWPYMIEKLDKRIARYNGNTAHDGTGIGDVVNGYLGHPAEAFIMAGRDRSNLLSEYIAAIERGEMEAPFIDFMEAEHRLASTDDIYGSGHLPDTISAGALAYRAAKVESWLIS